MVRDSLFFRILVPLFLALSACWIVFIFILGRASYKELHEVMDEQMIQTAQMLSVPMDYNKLPELRFSENDNDDDEDYRIHFSVWNKDENIIYADKRGSILPSSFENNGFSKIRSGNEEYRVYTYHNPLTGLSVSAGYPRSVNTRILEEVIEKFWLPWLLGLAALAIVLFVSLKWGFRPLYNLQKEITKRDPDHLDLFTTPVPYELRKLKAELNRLLEKVSQYVDKERRFISDAAHELKTPLAAIRVQTEVLAMEVAGTDQKNQANKIISAVDRSNHLVEQLLTLSRMDEKQGLSVKHSLSLENIFLHQVHELKNLFDARNAKASVVVKGRFELSGDETLIAILFKNLIENSLKYSDPSVQITLKLDHDEFSITDTGPGLSDDSLHRAGERFFRPQGQLATGSGLGLSIVAKIAELHGLKMLLRNSLEGGLTVTFRKNT